MKTRYRLEPNRGVWPSVYFAVLSLAVWAPVLFSGGYVLLGDMVFAPAMNPNVSMLGPPRGLMSVALVLNLTWILSRVIGAVLLQKLLLFSLVFLPGYLMYRNAPTRNRWAALFAGTLYAVNPFIYTRLLMGHWGLVLGYALLPVAVISALKTFREPTAARCAGTALWLALVALISINMGIIAFIVTAFLWIFSLGRLVRARVLVGALVAILVLLVLLSAFYTLPSFHSAGLASVVGRADLEAFQTRSTSKVGTPVSVLGLYGFWKLQLDKLMPRRYVPLWWVFIVILILLALFGAARAWREPSRGPLAKALLVCGVLGFFLALGSVAPVTGRLFLFLYDHLPVVKVFREPQKFAAMLALAYAMLGAIGVERMMAGGKRRPRRNRAWRNAAVVLLLLLTLLYSFRAFGGLWGQARAVQYPGSWAQAKSILDREAGDSRVFFVPTYWYMRFDFTKSDQTIASPLPTYFEQRNDVGVAIEVFGRRLDAGAQDRYLDAALSSARQRGNLGAMLAPLDVRFVLFVRNAASEKFTYVLEQKDLKVVRSWPDLVLLENKVPAHRLVEVSHDGSYRDLGEVGAVARGTMLVGSHISRGPGTAIPATAGIPIDSYDSRPYSVSFDAPSGTAPGASVLFSEEYAADWRLNGKPPGRQLGVTCAFPLDGAGTGRLTVRYRNPYIIAGYAISFTGLLLCAILLLAGKRLEKSAGGREGDRS